MIYPIQQFIDEFKKSPGALSVSESIALMNITSGCKEGNYIECGSNAGKSGMSAAYGLPEGKFYMIDPIFDLTNLEAWKHSIQGHPSNLAWGYASEPDFKDKVMSRIIFASMGRVEPILLGSYSELELPKYGDYSFAFIDSDNHQRERVFTEISILEDKMVQGGIIAFHDFGNQYIYPKEGHSHLIATGKYENVEINWSEIFDYVRENKLEDGNNSWHEKGSEEFPKFVGAARRK